MKICNQQMGKTIYSTYWQHFNQLWASLYNSQNLGNFIEHNDQLFSKTFANETYTQQISIQSVFSKATLHICLTPTVMTFLNFYNGGVIDKYLCSHMSMHVSKSKVGLCNYELLQ